MKTKGGAAAATPATFEEQLVALLPRLKACAVYLTKDAVQATHDDSLPDDLLQKTSLRALSRAHQFQTGDFFSWLYRIMRSIWFSELRSQKVRAAVPYDDDLHADRHVENSALARLMISDIRRACTHVTDEAFDLVIRFHTTGETYEEIALDLGVSVWTLRARVTRTKEKIMQRMRELGNVDDED